MPQPLPNESKPMKALRILALKFPEAQEGISCRKCAFKARDKAFFFMGMDETTYNLMLKLRVSLPEAAGLAAKFPTRYAVGGHGWVKLTFPHAEAPPPGLMERWLAESYRLLAPKPLVALLTAGAAPVNTKRKRAAKTRTCRQASG